LPSVEDTQGADKSGAGKRPGDQCPGLDLTPECRLGQHGNSSQILERLLYVFDGVKLGIYVNYRFIVTEVTVHFAADSQMFVEADILVSAQL
jgi:hypothetical protein